MRLHETAASPASRGPRSRGGPVGALLVGLGLGVLGTLLIGLAIAGPLVVAKRNDLPLERAYGDFAVSLAARFGGGNQQNLPWRHG